MLLGRRPPGRSDGAVLVAYLSEETLWVGCALCSGGHGDRVDTVGQGLDVSITIGADDLGLMAYLDQDDDDLKVAHCGNATCTP